MYDGMVYLADLMVGEYQVARSRRLKAFSDATPRTVTSVWSPTPGITTTSRRPRGRWLSSSKVRRSNLVANNCECYVNRAMHGQSTSTHVINTAIGVLLFAKLIFFQKLPLGPAT